MEERTVHYSSIAKLTTGISTGTGECGEHGLVSGYPAYITCPACKLLYAQDNSAENIAQARLQAKSLFNWR